MSGTMTGVLSNPTSLKRRVCIELWHMFKHSFKMALSPTCCSVVVVVIHANDFKITSHVLRQENLKVVIKRQAVKSAGSFIKHSNRGKLEQSCTISFVG